MPPFVGKQLTDNEIKQLWGSDILNKPNNMSKLFSLNLNDWLKGLVVAIISAVLTLLIQQLQTGNIDWKDVAGVGAIAGMSYILKNLATSDEGKLLGKF